MKTKYIIILLVIVAVVAYLIGNPNLLRSKPSEADCNRVANYLLIINDSDSYMQILSVKKINAIDGQDPYNGQKFYGIDTEVTIKLLKECEWRPYRKFKAQKKESWTMNYEPKPPGFIGTFEYRFVFYKTENGWQWPDGNIY